MRSQWVLTHSPANFILDSVAALKEQGVTVIYTSHYLQEIEQLCDKLVLLNEGNLIYQGTVQGILEEGQSLERFLFRFFKSGGKNMLIASIFKEMRLLSRDLHGVAVLFIMPILFMLIMSGGIE